MKENKNIIEKNNGAEYIPFKERYKKKRKNIKLKLIILLFIILGSMIFFFRVENVGVEGTERYNSEEMKSYLISNIFKDNTLLLKLGNIINKSYKIPYVDSINIRILSPRNIVAEVKEVEVAYQMENEGKYYDISKDFIIQGDTAKRDINKILIKNIALNNYRYGEEISTISDADKTKIGAIYNSLKKNAIKDFNEITVEDGKFYLASSNIKVELGKGEDIEKKMKVLVNSYAKISQYSGVLYLNEYKSDDSGYRFKKNIE